MPAPTTPAQRPVRLSLRAEGPVAFFPDAAGSPCSLPWPEPATARALLESVLWKPRMRWEVRSLVLERPLRMGRHPCPEDAPPLGLGAGEQILCMEDVSYVIHADLYLVPSVSPRDAADNHGKYAAMFHRRLAQGRPHHPAFFGLRGFPATLSPVPPEAAPLPLDLRFGPMRADGDRGCFQAEVVGGVMVFPG